MPNITTEQIEFIKLNHKTMTAREIGRKLNICNQKILRESKKFGIIFNRCYDNSNIEQFKNITNPKIAYFLGFCWADSTINYREKDKNRPCSIALELVKDDCDYVESVVKDLFKYSSYERQRPNRQPQKTIAIDDVRLAELLVKEMEFGEKSFKFPTNLLQRIPIALQHYFWRGLSDGDATFKQYFSIGENYDFDWSVFIDLLSKLNINTHFMRKYINPKTKHKFSSIRLRLKESCDLLDYFYSGYEKDSIGLPRKYQVYLKVKQRVINFCNL